MSESELTWSGVGLSDIGRRRQVNQDAFLVDDRLGLWVVADGMGGHAAGEVASQEAVDTLFGMVKQGRVHLSTRHGPDALARAAMRLIEGAVQAATYMVYAMAELDTSMSGMGTTVSALLSMEDFAVTAQVGDSRIYRIRSSAAEQLTEDHTLINWQLKQGLITPEEARHSKKKNVITRAIGNRDYVQVDTKVVDVRAGDQFLLCSDGLHGHVDDDELAAISGIGGKAAVQQFIDVANARGGRDNITAVLVQVS
jgi:serine/threonine protein phosphatase PrpC